LADSWNEFVVAESLLCRDRQIRLGVHDHLAEGIPDCLARANLDDVLDRALLHADLTSSNVMIGNSGGRWNVTGSIDFADALIGAPVYDLSPPALLIAQSDRTSFKRFSMAME
jgi:hygromycin-B 7''-O-kinase